MMNSILTFCLRQWVLMLVGALALGAGGIYALSNLPIDAFPDVTNIQVQVVTKAEGLSPVEVEKLITYPIEIQISGIQGLVEIRSHSNFGLSQVTIVFEDNMDIYFARQLVLERLINVRDQLPVGVEPSMTPVTTGLGEIYQYYLERSPNNQEASLNREEELTLMRTVQDWIIRPILKGLPGVIEVNALGGFVKQYQVLIDPGLLRKYDLALSEVFDALRKNNSNAGGNLLERGAEKIIVHGVGLIENLQDIEDIVVKEVEGTPVFVRDVGKVQFGHAIRHGAAVLNGDREVVTGVVMMLRGANARKVVNLVKQKVEEIHDNNLLPAGIRIKPFYDRTTLINAALTTVFKALVEGIFLVVVVLFFFLGDVRSAFVVIGTLILTPLITFIVMKEMGLTANLMSLGGLAIGVGMIVDASIVVVENIYRYLCHSHPANVSPTELIIRATREVAQPVIFGILIIILVFLPLLTLEGMEGKMFAPLAYTIMIALLVSLILSLILSPVFCSLWVKGGEETDAFVIRHAKRAYVPILEWAIAHPKTVLTSAVTLVAGTVLLIPFLGTIFIPVLEEGALTPQTIRYPSISLEESIEVEKKVHKALLEFPEVESIVGKIGRSELANDPTEPHESDPIANLIDRDSWTTAHTKEHLVEAMRERIASIPGVNVIMSQPIQERVEELISGIRSEIAIKLYGPDLEALVTTANSIAETMKTVEGVRDLRVQHVFGQPYLTIDIDRQEIARFGINVSDIREIIVNAIGGEAATTVYEEERRFQLITRFPEHFRNNPEAIRNILVKDASGAFIPLEQLARVEVQDGPMRISREQLQRMIIIGFNIVGRDIGSIVEEGKKKISENVVISDGYSLVWSGAFENMERAMARLKIVIPLTIGLIFFLLFSSFNSFRYAALIIINLPLAAIGGVIGLAVTGQYLSVPASIGFVNLFGVAVLNGIVLVSYINKLRQEGLSDEEAILQGCQLRLRPVLTTAMVALLGLLPLAFAQGIGSEVQRPLAVVVIGGLISSTFLTLLVIPAFYPWFKEKVAIY